MFIRVYRDSPFVNRAETRTKSYFITQIFSERKDTASAFDTFLQNVQTGIIGCRFIDNIRKTEWK